jgi:hypothetical protein
MFVHDMLGIAESGSVFGAFVCGIGCEFSAVGGPMLFDFFGFLLGEFGFRGGLIVGSVEPYFILPFFLFSFFAFGVNFFGVVIFLKICAAAESVSVDVLRSFFMFCFDQFGGEGHNLVLAQFCVAACGRGV